eukprot:scaffold22074_cov90-Isochrysis_galbana.AAC.1
MAAIVPGSSGAPRAHAAARPSAISLSRAARSRFDEQEEKRSRFDEQEEKAVDMLAVLPEPVKVRRLIDDEAAGGARRPVVNVHAVDPLAMPRRQIHRGEVARAVGPGIRGGASCRRSRARRVPPHARDHAGEGRAVPVVVREDGEAASSGQRAVGRGEEVRGEECSRELGRRILSAPAVRRLREVDEEMGDGPGADVVPEHGHAVAADHRQVGRTAHEHAGED